MYICQCCQIEYGALMHCGILRTKEVSNLMLSVVENLDN